MYLKDFGAEPSCGNLHLSTYLKIIVLKISFTQRNKGDSAVDKSLTWLLDHPSSWHFLHSLSKSFLSLESAAIKEWKSKENVQLLLHLLEPVLREQWYVKVKETFFVAHWFHKTREKLLSNNFTFISGWVSINSPREGSRVKPLTPYPVLTTSCKTPFPRRKKKKKN